MDFLWQTCPSHQISFRQCITFNEHRQLKGWQPHFQPSVANSSISTILHCFVGFVPWKHLADFCKMPKQMALQTTNQKVWSKLHCDRHEYELLGSREDCKIWVQKIYGEKSFQSITDSQLQHLTMFELDCDSQLNNSPLLTLWSLHELNIFAIALLPNKPCLWGLCVQSSMVKCIAHMHSVHLFSTVLDFLTLC